MDLSGDVQIEASDGDLDLDGDLDRDVCLGHLTFCLYKSRSVGFAKLEF